ncbi:peptidoglycan-binding protein [Kitasatospora sp. NPDC004669]|uniref:peptidoglycan-binding protein n=1 Tax=Kitasatospora sp. NPDC004669 TaxID=3154555 RepID=UPI00339F65AF
MTTRAKRRRPVGYAVLAALGLLAGTACLATVHHPAQASTSHPGPARSSDPTSGKWISFTDNHLVYGHDAQGNRIPDYSYAGYQGGGVALPTNVPVKATVPAPGGQDDTAAVQAAINQVSALPLDANGFRGAVQLARGTYRIAGTLNITASGVVLRGASANAADTTLAASGANARMLLTIGGNSTYATVGSPQAVTDDYVPVGGQSLSLASAAGFKVGDEIVIERPTTQAWIDALGMQNVWQPNWSLRSERRITAVKGNTITFDAPLTTALEKQYTNATVYHYTFPRIDLVGLENLTADGQAMGADPNYAQDFYNSGFAQFDAVQDSWVRNVTTQHFGDYGVAFPSEQSRRITEDHVSALNMLTTDSSARSFGFLLGGQQNLIQNCALTAPKVHAFVPYKRTSGPNVFSKCTATQTDVSYDAGGHERWDSGTLYDDVNVQGNLLMVNNGDRGSGHGWSDANATAWNCTTQGTEVQDPPTAHNWAIGCTGTVLGGSNGELQSPGAAVAPASLYDQQLQERTAAARK